jgi:hypothetical protein
MMVVQSLSLQLFIRFLLRHSNFKCSYSLTKATTLLCLIGVDYHSESCVVITFYWHCCFLPAKLHHILRCAY